MDRSKTSYALLTRTENTTSDCVNELTKKIPNERKPKTKKNQRFERCRLMNSHVTRSESDRLCKWAHANERVEKGGGAANGCLIGGIRWLVLQWRHRWRAVQTTFSTEGKTELPISKVEKKKIMCDKIETKRKRHERRFFFLLFCFSL